MEKLVSIRNRYVINLHQSTSGKIHICWVLFLAHWMEVTSAGTFGNVTCTSSRAPLSYRVLFLAHRMEVTSAGTFGNVDIIAGRVLPSGLLYRRVTILVRCYCFSALVSNDGRSMLVLLVCCKSREDTSVNGSLCRVWIYKRNSNDEHSMLVLLVCCKSREDTSLNGSPKKKTWEYFWKLLTGPRLPKTFFYTFFQ